MNFIISNRFFNGSKRIGLLYFSDITALDEDGILIFDGWLYPEHNLNLKKLYEKIKQDGIEFIEKIKGNFTGAYYNKKDDILSIFNDPIGFNDLFVYDTEDLLLISNNFNNLMDLIKLKQKDIDIIALKEFLIFEFPLFEKTFHNDILWLPNASLWKYDLKSHTWKKKTYWDYIYGDFEQLTIDNLDHLFTQSINRIKNSNKNFRYGLGLSGGLDSRLTAFYAKKVNLQLTPFIFGESNSDAYYVANKIAYKMELNLKELGYDPNFFRFFSEQLKCNPMMNLLYTWYASIKEKLPEFDLLLTGFLGDPLFGSHLRKEDKLIENLNQLIDSIFNFHDEINARKILKEVMYDFEGDKILEHIYKNVIRSKNKEFWQIKAEFDLKNRQRKFIKRIPAFSFFCTYNQKSIFADLDLVNAVLKSFNFEDHIDQKFYLKFFKAKMPYLYLIRRASYAGIKNKGINYSFKKIIKLLDLKIFRTKIFYKESHKNIAKWLKNNSQFISFFQTVLEKDNEIFFQIFKKDVILTLFQDCKTNNDYNFLFRIITIKLWFDIIFK